jgi:hypothetical protein
LNEFNARRICVTLQEYSHRIGDNKRLSEYLKLPIQRINDFQVLLQVTNQSQCWEMLNYSMNFPLQDLITHSRELREDTKDLQKAHEFMLALPQRLTDSKFIENLSGYKGNIHKLGRLLRHVSLIELNFFWIHRDVFKQDRRLFIKHGGREK